LALFLLAQFKLLVSTPSQSKPSSLVSSVTSQEQSKESHSIYEDASPQISHFPPWSPRHPTSYHQRRLHLRSLLALSPPISPNQRSIQPSTDLPNSLHKPMWNSLLRRALRRSTRPVHTLLRRCQQEPLLSPRTGTMRRRLLRLGQSLQILPHKPRAFRIRDLFRPFLRRTCENGRGVSG
jgi:hypothetical protein